MRLLVSGFAVLGAAVALSANACGTSSSSNGGDDGGAASGSSGATQTDASSSGAASSDAGIWTATSCPTQCRPSEPLPPPSAADDWAVCATNKCDAEYRAAFGDGYRAGTFTGPCKAYGECRLSCSCDFECLKTCVPGGECVGQLDDLTQCLQTMCSAPPCKP